MAPPVYVHRLQRFLNESSRPYKYLIGEHEDEDDTAVWHTIKDVLNKWDLNWLAQVHYDNPDWDLPYQIKNAYKQLKIQKDAEVGNEAMGEGEVEQPRSAGPVDRDAIDHGSEIQDRHHDPYAELQQFEPQVQSRERVAVDDAPAEQRPAARGISSNDGALPGSFPGSFPVSSVHHHRQEDPEPLMSPTIANSAAANPAAAVPASADHVYSVRQERQEQPARPTPLHQQRRSMFATVQDEPEASSSEPPAFSSSPLSFLSRFRGGAAAPGEGASSSSPTLWSPTGNSEGSESQAQKPSSSSPSMVNPFSVRQPQTQPQVRVEGQQQGHQQDHLPSSPSVQAASNKSRQNYQQTQPQQSQPPQLQQPQQPQQPHPQLQPPQTHMQQPQQLQQQQPVMPPQATATPSPRPQLQPNPHFRPAAAASASSPFDTRKKNNNSQRKPLGLRDLQERLRRDLQNSGH